METFIFDEVAFKGPILHFKVKRPISIAGTVEIHFETLIFNWKFGKFRLNYVAWNCIFSTNLIAWTPK